MKRTDQNTLLENAKKQKIEPSLQKNLDMEKELNQEQKQKKKKKEENIITSLEALREIKLHELKCIDYLNDETLEILSQDKCKERLSLEIENIEKMLLQKYSKIQKIFIIPEIVKSIIDFIGIGTLNPRDYAFLKYINKTTLDIVSNSLKKLEISKYGLRIPKYYLTLENILDYCRSSTDGTKALINYDVHSLKTLKIDEELLYQWREDKTFHFKELSTLEILIIAPFYPNDPKSIENGCLVEFIKKYKINPNVEIRLDAGDTTDDCIKEKELTLYFTTYTANFMDLDINSVEFFDNYYILKEGVERTKEPIQCFPSKDLKEEKGFIRIQLKESAKAKIIQYYGENNIEIKKQ
jgi:hypothetical protein